MIEEFWARFVAATGINGGYEAWAFGDEEALPDLLAELAVLVCDRPKRATAGLLAEYEDKEVPASGELSLILDGASSPVCVIRTTEVEVRRFGDVDEAFAWDEGGGDRTLEWWRKAHKWFLVQQGVEVDDDRLTVLERFEPLWPGGTDE